MRIFWPPLLAIGAAIFVVTPGLEFPVLAQNPTFVLGGASLALSDVSPQVDVYFRSMRFNRAAGVWNVEVSLTNHSAQALEGPFVLRIEKFSGTTGPLAIDGLDNSVPGKPFYDLSASVAEGVLLPGGGSAFRTLTFGIVSGAAPAVSNRVFALPPRTTSALGLVHSLDAVGHPLPGVQVVEMGPLGQRTNMTDAVFGFLTVGQSAGLHVWTFSKEGYLSGWRQLTLSTGAVAVVPSPRLTARTTNVVSVTPIGNTGLTNGDATVQLVFGPGTVTQNTSVAITSLTGQTLPAFLPLGWSPLQAFDLVLSSEPAQPMQAALKPAATVGKGEVAAVSRWNAGTLHWETVQILTGDGTPRLAASLPGSGTYAVVVGDTGPLAAPPPRLGQPLPDSGAPLPDPAFLQATGLVEPNTSPASRVPELVTGNATVIITNISGPLPSGLVLQGEVHEQYALRHTGAGLPPAAPGTTRHPPQYQTFMVGYQRPGKNNGTTLQMSFPLRPLLLFGAEELDQATVAMDLLTPTPFAGGVLETNGGQISSGGIRITAGAGDLAARQATQLRLLEATNFSDFNTNGLRVLAAFELSIAGVAPTHHLVAQFNAAPTNAAFALARVLYDRGLYGLQPVERMVSDANGRLSTAEPLVGLRLGGLIGAGQYVLLQLNSPEALVSGTARNSAGQATGGLPVQIAGQPWLAFSEVDGSFKLLAPAGDASVVVTDLSTSDRGTQNVHVTDPQTPVSTALAAIASGPRVVNLAPTNTATSVSRVSSVAVEFDKSLNPASLLPGGITLLDGSNSPVAASLSLSLNGTVVTLLPVSPLAPGTLHTIFVSTNLTDLAGRTLVGPNQFTFTTESDVLTRVGAQVDCYEPVNGRAGIAGSPGTADPEAPVILLNDTTGETVTILSRADGSFSNTIPASVDDSLRIVLVNQNGTRTSLPATRQFFKDGSVGLFSAGGTLEAAGENGTIQLVVDPGSIKAKAQFKVNSVSLEQVKAITSNAVPVNATPLGGFVLQVKGELSEQEIHTSFPVNPATLPLPPGVAPEDANYLLTVVTTVDGITAYHVIDKMTYQNGKLVAQQGPFMTLALGIIGLAYQVADASGVVPPVPTLQSAAMTLMLSPLLIANRSAFTYRGEVSEVVSAGTNQTAFDRILPGSIVTAFNVDNRTNLNDAVNRSLSARVVPGEIYAITDQRGIYGMHIGIVDGFGQVLIATHPRFLHRRAAAFGPQFSGPSIAKVDLVFPDDPSQTGDGAPPVINIAQSPFRPPVGGTATVTVSASDNDVPITIHLSALSVSNLVAVNGNVNASALDPATALTVTNASRQAVGHFAERDIFGVSSLTNLELVVALRATATDKQGQTATNDFTIFFGGADLVGTNAIPPSDPNDTVGPSVVQTWPPAGGTDWTPGVPLRAQFSEAIDSQVVSNSTAITISPSAGPPSLSLSADQSQLSISFPDLKPDTAYTVTFTTQIQDLAGNHFDQDPGSPGLSFYELHLRTTPQPTGSLPNIQFGGGAVLRGRYAYTLERLGDTQGGLRVFDLNNPTAPTQVGDVFNLPSFPRDFVLVPSYAFKRMTNGPAETNDLLVIAGGTVGGVPGVIDNGFLGTVDVIGGPWIWVVSISDPAKPSLVAAALLSEDTLSVVPKLVWDPPFIGYLETSADYSSIGLINLQAFILDFYLTAGQRLQLPPEGTPGTDADGNGDFVGPNDTLPLPSRLGGTFGGKVLAADLGDTRQVINDFAVAGRGFLISVVVGDGVKLDLEGEPTNIPVPPAYRTLVAGNTLERDPASVLFSNAQPTRVTLLLSQQLTISNQPVVKDLALVSLKKDSGTNSLVVIDISDPLGPKIINEISVGTDTPFSVFLRDDSLIELATANNVLLLDRQHLADPGTAGSIPALVGDIPGAGAGARKLEGNSAGLNVVSLGNKNEIIQTAPSLQFVSSTNLIPYGSLTTNDPGKLVAGLLEETSLLAARIETNGGAASTVSPPHPGFHYYVLVHAPGSAGSELTLGLESLNRAGYPLKNKGRDFPPVRALSEDGLTQIGQQVRPGCDLNIRPLLAHRLTDNKASPFYNLYLSKPFVMTYERLDQGTLDRLRSELDREILWSGHYLRAFLDTSMSGNNVVGVFAATADSSQKLLLPRASAVAETFPATYIMGPNPPGLAGHDDVPGTFGTISAHNGEFRHDTIDLAIPGRHMPIVFQRVIGGQDTYEGPFGRGWDFYHNQHLTELRQSVFAPTSRKPLVVRATLDDSSIAEQKDVEFHSGEGRTVLFKFRGKDATQVSELKSDPLVQQLGWKDKEPDYYIPERGCFDLLFRFQDGQFARLTPDGSQFWYSKSGRLEKIYDRYPTNQHTLTYNSRGELTKITDKSIPNDARYLELGHWRLDNDTNFVDGLDARTNNVFVAGRICALRDYAGRVVSFGYDDEGTLAFRDGIAVNGANGGFQGRQRTLYLTPDGCSPALGLVTGNGSAESGTPLFAVQSTNAGGAFSAGAGAAGSVGYAPPGQNSADSIENGTATATGPDGARTQFTFNKDGYAKEIQFLGSTGGGPGQNGTATYTREFDTNGLLTRIVFPEGTETQYTYFTNSPNLRSHANLQSETHIPHARGGPTLTASYTYDENYNVRNGMIDFENNPITYILQPDGREVKEIRYPGAGSYTFTFNDFGQLESETTPEGVTIDPDYAPDTGFVSVRRVGDMQTEFSYNDGSTSAALGMPNKVHFLRGQDLTCHYDNRLQLIDMTRDALQEFRGYDTNGNLVSIKRTVDDGEFYEETRTYNQFNFLSSVTMKNLEVDGQTQDLTIQFAPDQAWRVQSITYPGQETRSFKYNHLGYLTHMELGGGSYFEDYGRDLHGNLTELKQGGLTIRTLGYDGHDRLIGITNKSDSGDQVVALTYHGNGERKHLTVSDPVYQTVADSDMAVDALGRPTSLSRSGTQLSALLSYSYPSSSTGGKTHVSGPRSGDFTDIAHDSGGRPDFFQNLLVNADFTPDGNGNITDVASSEGSGNRKFSSHFSYDGLDHLQEHTDDVGRVLKYDPRADGRVKTITDGLNNSSSQTFTRLGEKTSLRRADGMVFNYRYSKQRLPTLAGDIQDRGHALSYDETFRAKSLTLRNGAAIKFDSPDPHNLPQSITLPGSGPSSVTYDQQGRILKQTLLFGANPYQIDGASYDALGRLRSIKYGDAAQYSASFDYDELGPLTSATFNEALGQFAVSHTIYEDGAVDTVVYPAPASVTVTEAREPSGRLKTLSLGSGDVLADVTTFESAELPGEVNLGNGAIREKNFYDQRKRLLARRYTDSGGGLLADVRYTYDLADNRTARQFIHRHGRADLFTYDAGNRLSRADMGARPTVPGAPTRSLQGFSSSQGFAAGFFSRTYNYDSSGLDELLGAATVNPDAVLLPPLPSFATSIGGHDDFLFATLVDGTNRAPDALGHTATTTLYVRGASGSDPIPVAGTLTYNGLGQLVHVARSDGIDIEYEYQPNGLLHHRRVRNGSTVLSESAWVYDRGRLIAEYSPAGGSNDLRARYYYADDDCPMAADIRDSGGVLRRYYYLQDEQGSVVAVANATGQVVERVNYDPFGQPVIEARDQNPPRVAAVSVGLNNELLVHFTERVMPPLASTLEGTNLVLSTLGLNSQFSINTTNGSFPAQVIYDEAGSGAADFGALLRVSTGASLPTRFTLQVNGGALVDEWGNSNLPQLIAVTNLGPAGTVLFQDPGGVGATAPQRLARSELGNPFLFHGQYFDYDTGLLYLRSRFYDPYTGQFLQPDPLGYEDSVNLYAGLGFNPVSERDPSGRLGVKPSSPSYRSTVPRSTSNGRVGAKYQKQFQYTMAGRRYALLNARNRRISRPPDLIARPDRHAFGARFRQQAGASISEHIDEFESAPTAVHPMGTLSGSQNHSALHSEASTMEGPPIEDLSTQEGLPVPQRELEDVLDEFFNTDLEAWAQSRGYKPIYVKATDARLKTEKGIANGMYYEQDDAIYLNENLKKNPGARLQVWYHEVGHTWFRRAGVKNRYVGANLLGEEAAVDLKGAMIELEVFQNPAAKDRSFARSSLEGNFLEWREEWLVSGYLKKAAKAGPGALNEFYRRFPGFTEGWTP